jgi:inositol transport system permease protein
MKLIGGQNTRTIESNIGNHRIANIYVKYGMFIIFIVMFIASCLLSPAFLTTNNLTNVIRLMSITGITAFGMTFVLILAMIDLSVGSIMALAGCCSAIVWAATSSPFLAILAGIVIGAVFGSINGLVVVKTGIPAFIMTYAMQTVARGAVYLICGGKPVSGMGVTFPILGQGDLNRLTGSNIPILGEIPLPIWIMAIMFLICWILMYKIRFGRYIYATGGNENAARASGVKTKLVIFKAFILTGICAAISGIMLMSRMNSGQPQAAVNYEFDAITACVVGGTSLLGGSGTLAGTLIGCLIIGILNNMLNLMGVSTYWQMVVRGLIIVTAVVVDYRTKAVLQRK